MEVKKLQVDHINENTIRVRINREELAQRGLKVLDLLGNRARIEHFFYSILREVDTHHDFGHGTPVSFQVMPNNGGLDLLISKVKHPTPNQYAQMRANRMTTTQHPDNVEPKKQGFFDLNPADDAKTEMDPALVKKNSFISNAAKNAYWRFQTAHAYCFDDLGVVVELADSLRVRDLASSLYYLQGEYFLKLVFLDENYAELKPRDAWAIANEAGIQINLRQMKSVEQRGKCLFARDALASLRYYFKDKNQD